MLVLVTGATGFVGRHLCEQLKLAGTPVRAVVRDSRAASRVPAGIETVVGGDFTTRTDWQPLVTGVDTVVHLAARVHVMAETAADPEALFQLANVEATVRLAQAARSAGARRFVFVSSIKVNGERTEGVPFRADDVPAPVDAYARSKRDAELRLRELGSETFQVAIVRPPLVYGPSVAANFQRLLGLAVRGTPLPFGSIRNARSLVSVWTLSDLLATLIHAPANVGGTWLVSDGEDLGTAELMRRLRAALGVPARLFACPVVILRTLGALLGKSAEIDRLTDSLQLDIRPTRERLHWSPPISAGEALERTARAWAAQRQAGPRDAV